MGNFYHHVTVRISNEEYLKIRKLCARKKINRSTLIRRALIEYIKANMKDVD